MAVGAYDATDPVSLRVQAPRHPAQTLDVLGVHLGPGSEFAGPGNDREVADAVFHIGLRVQQAIAFLVASDSGVDGCPPINAQC